MKKEQRGNMKSGITMEYKKRTTREYEEWDKAGI